jgi:hypothetical protein
MLSLNLDLNYFTNPKVERLTCILGEGSEIHHVRLMAYVGKCGRKHGGLDDWSADEVEAAAHWYGEKGRLVDVLLKVKLMHPWKNGFKLHDWKDHASHLISYDDKCEMNRKRAKDGWEKRRKSRSGKEKKPDASGMPVALPKTGNGNANTKQNKTETLIENYEPSSPDIQDASMSPLCEEVYRYWVDAKSRIGLRTITKREKPDAARVTAFIQAGQFTQDDYRQAVDNLMGDPESAKMYGLGGLLRNINTWVNRPQKPKPSSQERHGLLLREIIGN